MLALVARAEPGYTNHAGNVVSGWPVKLTATQVVLQEGGSPGRAGVPSAAADGGGTPSLPGFADGGGTPSLPGFATAPVANCQQITTYPLSIFPESERRRIAADFGQPRVPAPVKRAIAGAEKAMARSRKRAEKGLCTKEESDAFCTKSEAALKSYLDRQVKEGVITPAERKALGYAY